MNDSIANVGTNWERRGIRNKTGATEADIVAFELKYDVKLPPVVRRYFSELKGTKIGELGMEDEHLIGFHLHFHVIPRYAADEFNVGDGRFPFGAVEVPLQERIEQARRVHGVLRQAT